MSVAILPFASTARPRNQEDLLWAEDARLVAAFSEYVAILEQLITYGPLLPGDRRLLQQFCACLDETEPLA